MSSNNNGAYKLTVQCWIPCRDSHQLKNAGRLKENREMPLSPQEEGPPIKLQWEERFPGQLLFARSNCPEKCSFVHGPSLFPAVLTGEEAPPPWGTWLWRDPSSWQKECSPGRFLLARSNHPGEHSFCCSPSLKQFPGMLLSWMPGDWQLAEPGTAAASKHNLNTREVVQPDAV